MTSLSIEDGRWALRVHPRASDLAKAVPGLKYDRKAEAWVGALNVLTPHVVRRLFGEQVDVTDEAYDYVRIMTAGNEAREAILSGEIEVPGPEHLFPFQVGSSHLMGTGPWFCNLDDRGNGKTVQALAAVDMVPGPVLVVCTKSMLWTWASEAERFSERTPYVLDGSAVARRKTLAAAKEDQSALVVCTWTVLTKHSLHAPFGSVKRKPEHTEPKELNGGWIRSVVADEVHKAVGVKAQQTRALWAVGDEAEVRIGLTATPLTNNALDLWGILRFLDPPSWPSRSKFREMFLLEVPNFFAGTEIVGFNPDTRSLFDTAWAPNTCRRPLQADVKALPAQVRFVDMTPKQATAYRAMKKRMVAEVDEGILAASDALVRDMRLLQIASATPVVDEAGEVTALTTPSCKYDALLDLLDEMNGDPLVVFAESRKLIEMIHENLTDGLYAPESVGIITGQVSAIERQSHVQRFQAGEVPVMLMTIGAGSEGLTLTRSNTVCFLQRSWKMVSNIQAEGRVLRMGQERDVQFIDIVSRGTVEERVHEVFAKKEQNLQDLVRDPEWSRRMLLG